MLTNTIFDIFGAKIQIFGLNEIMIFEFLRQKSIQQNTISDIFGAKIQIFGLYEI